MSQTKKIVLTVTAVLVVCAIAICLVAIGQNTQTGELADIGIDEEAALDLAGVSNVVVECVLGDIKIMPGEPFVTLTGNISTSAPKDKYLSVTHSGGTLTVKFDAQALFPHTITGNVTMTVCLPQQADVDLFVTGASADADINGLAMKNLSIESASGHASVSDCSGDALRAELSSGKIRFTDTDFAHIDAQCVSGNVRIEKATGDVNVTGTSGIVRITDAGGKVDVKSTSGNVSVTQTQPIAAGIVIDTVSGNVELGLSPEAAFNLSVYSVSGTFDTDFDVTVNGSIPGRSVGVEINGKVNGGGSAVLIDTTAGDIQIMKVQ